MSYVNFLANDPEVGSPSSGKFYTDGFSGNNNIYYFTSNSFSGLTGTSSGGAFTVHNIFQNAAVSQWRYNSVLVELSYYIKFGSKEFNKFLMFGNGYIIFDNNIARLYDIGYFVQNSGSESTLADFFWRIRTNNVNLYSNFFSAGLNAFVIGGGNYSPEDPYPYYLEIVEYVQGTRKKVKIRWSGRSWGQQSYPTPPQYTSTPQNGDYVSSALNFIHTFNFTENEYLNWSIDYNSGGYDSTTGSNIYWFGYYGSLDYTLAAIVNSSYLKSKTNPVDSNSFVSENEYQSLYYYGSSGFSWSFKFDPLETTYYNTEFNKLELYGFGQNANWSDISAGGAAYNLLPYDTENPLNWSTISSSQIRKEGDYYIIDIDMSMYNGTKPIVISSNQPLTSNPIWSYPKLRFNFTNLDLPLHSSIKISVIFEPSNTYTGNVEVHRPLINDYQAVLPENNNYITVSAAESQATYFEFYVRNISLLEVTDYYNGVIRYPENSYKVSWFNLNNTVVY